MPHLAKLRIAAASRFATVVVVTTSKLAKLRIAAASRFATVAAECWPRWA